MTTRTTRKGWRPILATAAALALAAAPLRAQELSYRAGGGVAFPTGDRRDAGLTAMASVERPVSPSWSLRLDLEWSRFNGQTASPGGEHFANYQDMRIVGAALNGILNLSVDDADIAPYLVGGLGGYWFQRADAPRNPSPLSGALQIGIGIDSHFWSRVNPFMEARSTMHLTEYGGADYTFVTYRFPVVVGIRIH